MSTLGPFEDIGTAVAPPTCRWCGLRHDTLCHLVKALEFFPDGTVKRVEFKTGMDYPPIALGGQHWISPSQAT